MFRVIAGEITRKEKIAFVLLALPISNLQPCLAFFLIFSLYSHYDLYGPWFPEWIHAIVGIFISYANIILFAKMLDEYETNKENFSEKVIKNLGFSFVIQCLISVLIEPPYALNVDFGEKEMIIFAFFVVAIPALYWIFSCFGSKITFAEKTAFAFSALLLSVFVPILTFALIFFIYEYYFNSDISWDEIFLHVKIGVIMFSLNILLFSRKMLQAYEKNRADFLGKVLKTISLSAFIQCFISIFYAPLML